MADEPETVNHSFPLTSKVSPKGALEGRASPKNVYDAFPGVKRASASAPLSTNQTLPSGVTQSLMKDHQHGGRDKENPYVIAGSFRTAVASPVPVDTVHKVGQTAALVVESGHAAHLPDIFPTLVGVVDSPAHIVDRDSVPVECLALVVSASGSASAPGAR